MRLLLILTLFMVACQNSSKIQKSSEGDYTTASGWTSVFQTMTSETETSINILRPRLANMAYVVEEYIPNQEFKWDASKAEKIIKTTKGPHIHWMVDRIHLKNLSPQKTYRLSVVNKWRKKAVDWRIFKTLDLKKKKARFIVGSCMSDSHAFEHVRNRIWDKMMSHDADFMMLLGDQVYVDDFDFVKRGQANEFDIWTRYIDSFRKIPLFQKRKLIPILSVWDDHDYGTNNSDKHFKSKKAAKKIYSAFFGGEPIKDTIEVSKNGVYFSFQGFGQKFLFMDNRYFREEKGKAPFGQWGKTQHQWFEKQLTTAKGPLWLANGGQFFTKATHVTRKDGSKKQVNESFVDDHPIHFKKLITKLKKVNNPVVFLSGDIHYSEIAKIEKEMLGYETYEITSSPLHSFMYRSKQGPETWLDNPRRIVSIKEYNYLLVDSQVAESVTVNVKSFGVKQDEPYFEKTLQVLK